MVLYFTLLLLLVEDLKLVEACEEEEEEVPVALLRGKQQHQGNK